MVFLWLLSQHLIPWGFMLDRCSNTFRICRDFIGFERRTPFTTGVNEDLKTAFFLNYMSPTGRF